MFASCVRCGDEGRAGSLDGNESADWEYCGCSRSFHHEFQGNKHYAKPYFIFPICIALHQLLRNAIHSSIAHAHGDTFLCYPLPSCLPTAVCQGRCPAAAAHSILLHLRACTCLCIGCDAYAVRVVVDVLLLQDFVMVPALLMLLLLLLLLKVAH